MEASDNGLRRGEVPVAPPDLTDAGVHFIGTIRTPWRSRDECPKRGSADGPICSIVVDERWRAGTDRYSRAPAYPGAVLDAPGKARPRVADALSHRPDHGTFALRSPVRPNPIAVSVVDLLAVDGTTLRVRGLDCLDGTPLIDLKPERNSAD